MTSNTATSTSRADRPQGTSQTPAAGPYSGDPSDDEISLVDLAKLIWERRWWMVGIAVVTFAAALLFALFAEREFDYVTSIRIGETNVNERVSTSVGVQEAIERRFLPPLRQSFIVEHSLPRLPFSLKVEADQNGEHVTLNSRSAESDEALVRSFHSELGALIASDHNRRIQRVYRQTEIRLDNLRTRLAVQQRRLEDMTALILDATAIALEDTEVLEESVGLNLGAQSPGMARPSFRPTLSSSDPSLTLLLSRVQLTELSTQYEGAISDLIREIEDVELRREWVTPTQVVFEAIRSESAVGTSRTLILVIGLVLGGMLGLLGVFVVEFITRVRASLENTSGNAVGGPG
jgi:hypothetical protein